MLNSNLNSSLRALIPLCLLTCFLLSFPSVAKGFLYWGAGFQNHNYSDLNFTSSEITSDISVTTKASDSSSGFRLMSGYQYNSLLGVEVGYNEYGSADFKMTQTIDTVATNLKSEFSSSSVDVRLTLSYSLTRNWFVQGIVGAEYWKNDFSYPIKSNDRYTNNKLKTDDISANVGVSLGYDLQSNASVYLQLLQTKIADRTTQTISLGFMRKF